MSETDQLPPEIKIGPFVCEWCETTLQEKNLNMKWAIYATVVLSIFSFSILMYFMVGRRDLDVPMFGLLSYLLGIWLFFTGVPLIIDYFSSAD